MTATLHEVPSRHSKHRRSGPRAALVLFASLALTAAAAGTVVRVARADSPSSPPEATVLLDTATTAARTDRSARLTARTILGSRALRFTVTTTRTPMSAVLTLTVPGGAPDRRLSLDLSTPSTSVVLRGLPVGQVRWVITADGAPSLRGTATITDPSTATTPSSAPRSGGSSTAPAQSPMPPPRDRVPSPPQPVSSPTSQVPTQAPTQEPTQAPTQTPRPTGPSSPYDPDDH